MYKKKSSPVHPLGIYIHIPFCIQLCPYCDFVKYKRDTFQTETLEAYQSSLMAEIKTFFENYPALEIKTVYFGGGTPSLYPVGFLEQILALLLEHMPGKDMDSIEITLEADPKTVGPKKIQMFRRLGINRLSIGAQSFNDDQLVRLGRYHKQKDIYRLVDDARQCGFENLSLDLMFGTPGQTREMFQHDLNHLVSLDPNHVSLYALSINRGTPFFSQRKHLNLPPDHESSRFYDDACRILKSYHIHGYEISNFSREGFKSQHNQDCWNLVPYAGFGVGACSYVQGTRWRNKAGIMTYVNNIRLRGHARAEIEILTEQDSMMEYAILSLRQSKGLRFKDFSQKFGKSPQEIFPVLDHMPEEYLPFLIQKKHSIKLSQRGKMVSNEIFQLFLP